MLSSIGRVLRRVVIHEYATRPASGNVRGCVSEGCIHYNEAWARRSVNSCITVLECQIAANQSRSLRLYAVKVVEGCNVIDYLGTEGEDANAAVVARSA